MADTTTTASKFRDRSRWNDVARSIIAASTIARRATRERSVELDVDGDAIGVDMGTGATRIDGELADAIAACADCGAFIVNRGVALDMCSQCMTQGLADGSIVAPTTD